MGTRGNFYLYVVIGNKKILLYTFYSHYDGPQNVNNVVRFYQRLMEKGQYTVGEVISALETKFGHDVDYLAGDAEYVYHAEMTPLQGCADVSINNDRYEYVQEMYTQYGGKPIAKIGDCYLFKDRDTNSDLETVNNLTVSLGQPYDGSQLCKDTLPLPKLVTSPNNSSSLVIEEDCEDCEECESD